MGTNTGALVGRVKQSNMQAYMRDEGAFMQRLDCNYGLAHVIYLFLTGKDNRLPSHEYIDRVINDYFKKKAHSEDLNVDYIISIGCGMCIYCKMNSDARNLTVEHESLISPDESRFDMLSGDNYKAYKRIVNKDYTVTYADINFENEPIFDPRRVEIVREYLREYALRVSVEAKRMPK